MSVLRSSLICLLCALTFALLLTAVPAAGEEVPGPVAASRFRPLHHAPTVVDGPGVVPDHATPSNWRGQDAAPLGNCGPRDGRPWWMLSCVPYCHGDPNHPRRHVGLGHPLEGTSWLNRPWHADVFLGGISPDPPTHVVTQDDAYIWGLRLGRDCDHYWGWEARLAFAQPTTANVHTGEILGTSTLYFYDACLLFYPWGDARWRPYLTAGLGLANVRFYDERGLRFAEMLLHVPFGLGWKYQLKRGLALRFEFLDDLVVSSANIRTMHNYSITGGVEVRLGGWRRRYFPYQ